MTSAVRHLTETGLLGKFYIDGEWRKPIGSATAVVVNPATERPIAEVALGSDEDVDRAVAAAERAFAGWSCKPAAERAALLDRIHGLILERLELFAQALTSEMGAAITYARRAQVPLAAEHIRVARDNLATYSFITPRGSTAIMREAIGVCGLITPWNFPINQVMCKVVPALAAGCTMVLKPSEISPLSALIIAEILHDAGVPAGVFNLVNGDGAHTGHALASHRDVDMVSFTGSTRGGIAVAKAAADTVKRVAQELGGKSPNIVLDDADLQKAVVRGVMHMMQNTGQSCNAPSRMFVPKAKHDQAAQFAKSAAESVKVGDPFAEGTTMGPVVSDVQFNKIQGLIKKGIDEGATLVTGGLGRPEGLNRGYYVRPTIFANVTNDMTIAREEIFGPVGTVIEFETDEQAVELANDSRYGLAATVWTTSLTRAHKVAQALEVGAVGVNCWSPLDANLPWGGLKTSGIGREGGISGALAYTEEKVITVLLP